MPLRVGEDVFNGEIGLTTKFSKAQWPVDKVAKKGSPNVLIWAG
jgi:hypothetical protein